MYLFVQYTTVFNKNDSEVAVSSYNDLIYINCWQLNSSAALESLGTLVAGIPSESITKISASELLSASKDPTFVSNIVGAPQVIQQTFVQKVQS